MSCGRWARDLAKDLTRETLPRDRREKLAAHLASCERCRALAAHLDELLGTFDSVQNASLSPRFWPLLHARLQARDAGGHKASRQAAMLPARLRIATASICLLVGTIAGIRLGDSYAARMAGRCETSQTPVFSEQGEPFSDLDLQMRLPSLAELLVAASHGEAKGEPEP